MEEYTLYLDESKNSKQTKFAIAGVIIKSSEVPLLDAAVLEAKKCLWDDAYLNNNMPILHCVEITNLMKFRNNAPVLHKLINRYKSYDTFKKFDGEQIKNAYDNVMSKMSRAVKVLDCATIGCLVDLEKTKYLYGNEISPESEIFFEVALQAIIENFAHFLAKHNATGNIVYESRNSSDALSNNSSDAKMFRNFCEIKICNKGISFVDEDTLYRTIKFFEIKRKKDDIKGLQLADFISYSFVQNYDHSTLNGNNEFTNKVLDKLYNGGFDVSEKDLRHYFGLKLLPFDYQQILEMRDQNTKLKKSNKNLKHEMNSLLKKNKMLIEKKEQLIKENNELKALLLKENEGEDKETGDGICENLVDKSTTQ